MRRGVTVAGVAAAVATLVAGCAGGSVRPRPNAGKGAPSAATVQRQHASASASAHGDTHVRPVGRQSQSATAAAARPVPFVGDPEAFNRSYRVSGKLVAHYFGSDHSVPPPSSAQSSWENAIATVFVRGETPLGQLGFSFGFDRQDRRGFHQLILFVPASDDASTPRDGYINMPLRQALPWPSGGLGTSYSSSTQDGTWVVTVTWTDARTVTVGIATARGHSAPKYLDHGTLRVRATGPASDPWRQLDIAIDTHARSGGVQGQLLLRSTGS